MSGETFGGRYQADQFIGVPGGPQAWAGSDTTNKAKVAIMTAMLMEDSDVTMWTARAQSVASLQNAPVARLVDWGADDHTFFVIQQWIDGESLGSMVAKTGPMESERVAAFGAQAAGALTALHAHHIVHGAMRPEDLVATPDNQIVLAGAGAPGAEKARDLPPDATPAAAQFLAPEQCAGGAPTESTDVYALGAILYYLATGKPAFDGPDAATVCREQREAPIIAPSSINSQISPSLEAVIMRAMAKSPTSRYGSAAELRQALEAVAAGGMGQTAVMPIIAAAPRKKRLIWPWIVAGVVVLALIAGGVFAAWWLGYINGVTVPNLSGQTPAQAQATITNAGLTVGSITAAPNYPPGAKLGTIFAQTPAAGSHARKGQAVTAQIAGGETVQLPSVVGQSESEAINTLNNLGFQIAPVARTFNAKVPAGSVISQAPAGGTSQLKGSSVTLTVSKGPQTAAIPDVLNQSEAAATAAIQNAGFKVSVQQIQSATVPQGQVAQQTPGGGTKAELGTTVSIQVSTGAPPPQQVVVPNVVGQTQNDALNSLQGIGLKVQINAGTANATKKGTVESQDPGAGSSVAVGTTVTIKVYQ